MGKKRKGREWARKIGVILLQVLISTTTAAIRVIRFLRKLCKIDVLMRIGGRKPELN